MKLKIFSSAKFLLCISIITNLNGQTQSNKPAAIKKALPKKINIKSNQEQQPQKQEELQKNSSSSSNRVINRDNRNNLTPELFAQAQKSALSILKPLDDQLAILYKNYPNGSQLFTDQAVANKFNTLINAIKNNSQKIEFLRKLYIECLNQLYSYFMKIYTNYNLTNPGVDQTKDPLKVNLGDYLADEIKYATNEKKLLMNHFINIIQNQFKGAIISFVPTTPPDMAVPLGKMFLANDCGIDLDQFTQDSLTSEQMEYINLLEKYIDFFSTYTKKLNQFDTDGINEYYKTAQAINLFLYNKVTMPEFKENAVNQALLKTNPAMFFYDVESMRSILFIPSLANKLPKGTDLIPLNQEIVKAAIKNSQINGHALAYFKDAQGKTTNDQTKGISLFLLTDVGPTLFEQEILAQPAWMNTAAGNIAVLQGCLGDISALVNLGILEEKTEAVIKKALNKK